MTTDSPPARRSVEVLLPFALDGAYSYAVPPELEVAEGDFVVVPLASRDVVGVVWGADPRPPRAARKLRPLRDKLDALPMPALQRRFIDWLADYYLAPSGMVLRMCMRVPAALGPAREERGYRLSGTTPAKLTPQRKRVMEAAAEAPAMRLSELVEVAGVSSGVVRGLIEAGALLAEPLPELRPFPAPELAGGVALSAQQAAAAQALRARIAARDFSVTLLDGVTGSGKTEVYFEAIAATVAAGRQALVLLPEIALTAQFIRRIEERFRAEPAEWHSAIRPRARERVWRAAASGAARILVGARSALFLPHANLGLIVVDEEHEGAFKQEEGVHYHARDMAVVLGALGRFPVVLSSATPSLESLVNVDRRRYGHVRLSLRHGQAELPAVGLVDMRKEQLAAGRWLSEALAAAARSSLEAGEQALLFLNRRGYAPLTLCRACGFRLECPNCAAWLVEHRFRRQLLCHHCGHVVPVPPACAACGAEGTLVPCGPGVERLAEEAAARFPKARVAILSSDLAHGAGLRELLRDVAEHRYDLIIGTQLVAKGHHFPELTFAGVVDADIALAQGDLRAAERTWQLLSQVAGRAGRVEKPGRALIQTYMPQHPLMQALASGDRDGFLAHEKQAREQAGLPPYGRLAAVVVSGTEAGATERFARELARQVPAAEGFQVLGPAPAPLALVRGRYRHRLLVKCGRDVNLQAFLRAWLDGQRPRGSLRLAIDVDPYSFL